MDKLSANTKTKNLEKSVCVEELAGGGNSTSPSCYREGMMLELNNKKRFVHQDEMRKLCEKGYLSDTDIFLMRKLYEYTYLTRYILSQAMNLDVAIPLEYKRSNYKQRINKMIHAGIILEYYITYPDTEEHRTRTPAYLSLSEGGRIFLQKRESSILKRPFFRSKDIVGKPNIDELLKKVAFNQFHIQFMAQQGVNMNSIRLDVMLKDAGRPCCIEGVYNFNKESALAGVSLVAIPVRSNVNSEKEVIRKIKACERYVASEKKEKLFRSPIYILISENADQCNYLERKIRGGGIPRRVPVFYIVDRCTFRDNILESLMEIVTHEKNGYEIIMQKLENE